MPSHFTPTELKTLHDVEFFRVKAAATEKMDALLAGVRDALKTEIKKMKIKFPAEVDASMGKIFRGENYRGLPYLILDYPKYFSKENVFAFRTLFWWGNFFSCTLHLQGKPLDERRSALINNWRLLRKKNIYICVNDTPWQYHYKKENYLPVDKFSEDELKQFFITKEFIKLSRKMELKDHKKIHAFGTESLSLFLGASRK